MLHGTNPLVSQLYPDKIIRAAIHTENQIFRVPVTFARIEKIFPVQESAHAIRGATELALATKKKNEAATIVFNLSGHGLFDMIGYVNFLKNSDHPVIDV